MTAYSYQPGQCVALLLFGTCQCCAAEVQAGGPESIHHGALLQGSPGLTVQLSLTAAMEPITAHIPLLPIQGHHPQPRTHCRK